MPSLQEPLVRGADAQVLVPLQESVVQALGSLVQVMPVPTQEPPPLQVSVNVQALPSLQVPLVRGAEAQVPVPLQESVVQAVGSLVQVMPVPAHVPAPLQVSVNVHALPSLQVPLVRGVDVHELVPLQARVAQALGSLVQVMPVPAHVPAPLQVSVNVQALLSLQVPLVLGAEAQVLVPLHESVVQALGSLVQVMAVPTQDPPPLQVSVYVQRLPSLHVPLVLGAEAHVLVPLQESVAQAVGSLVQVIAVPTQDPPPLQVSVYVQRLPSLQVPLVLGADAHVLVPLHESVVQAVGSLVQVIAVPTQEPAPLQVSVYVQALLSLQVPLVLGAEAQVLVPLHESVVQALGSLVQAMPVPTQEPAPCKCRCKCRGCRRCTCRWFSESKCRCSCRCRTASRRRWDRWCKR